MSSPLDNDKLLEAIRDVESRLNSIRLALAHNETEINTLITLEAQLRENILELKRKYIIALALEFRKAREDLRKTTTRLALLRIDHATYTRALNSQLGVLEFLNKKLEENAKRLKNNVIKGKFGKKDGG